MALSAFDDKSSAPRPAELAAKLGKTAALWTRLVAEITDRHAPITEAWNCAGKAYGWSLRLKRRERTVLYMIPCQGHFLVAFVLGEKAIAAARDAGLPAEVMAAIEGARKYAEGRGVRLEVHHAKDVETMKRLAEVKMSH